MLAWRCRYARGPLLSITEDDPKVDGLIQRVQPLNGVFADQYIEHLTIPDPMHAGFYRSYSREDEPGFDFQWSARLYSLGCYQRIKRDKRKAILINDEPVVEVDVSSSHLTILHAMIGVPLHPSADAYTIAGIDRRSVVKRFVTMTLGNGRFQRVWPKEVREAYLEDDLKIEKATTIQYRLRKAGWKARELKHYTPDELSYLQRDYPFVPCDWKAGRASTRYLIQSLVFGLEVSLTISL